MDNQHRKISGYRELSEMEIDLMNRIKSKSSELLELQEELVAALNEKAELSAKCIADEPEGCTISQDYVEAKKEFDRFHDAEPFKWAAIGKTEIQKGTMALVRAVAQPKD
jgi:hypothetical protein